MIQSSWSAVLRHSPYTELAFVEVTQRQNLEIILRVLNLWS